MDTISDKKFFMVFTVVMGILTAIAVAVAVIANIAGSIDYEKSRAKIDLAAERIEPVGKLNLASNPTVADAAVVAAADTSSDTAAATPESLYTTACGACHTPGIAGAPKFAEPGAWTNRIGKGIDTLTSNAINGIGAMPARGGSSLSDDEIKAVVEYMLDALK